MPTLRATLTLAATLAGCTPSAPPAEESAVPPPSEPTAAAPPSTATATPDAPAAADPDAPTAADPDAPAAADPDAPPTAFQAVVRILTAEERAAMTGVSWHEGCPVPLSDLRVLELTHHRPEGPSARGQLIAHADAAEVLVGAFETLWDIGFPITRMEPVRVFGGDADVAGQGLLQATAITVAVDGGDDRNPRLVHDVEQAAVRFVVILRE